MTLSPLTRSQVEGLRKTEHRTWCRVRLVAVELFADCTCGMIGHNAALDAVLALMPTEEEQ